MSKHTLLPLIGQVSTAGSRISSNMLTFLDSVPTQPLGFRDMGLNFLEISRILNALETSLEEHFRTNQPFPEKAIPELERVLRRTEKDFSELEVLLGKFMKYEEGGITGRVMKTWRMVFADKDVMKVGKSLGESKGALNMAVLLVNVNPDGVKMGGHYQVLEQRLYTQAQAGSEVSLPSGTSPISPPSSAPISPPAGNAVEIDGTSIGPGRYELDGSKEAEASPQNMISWVDEPTPEPAPVEKPKELEPEPAPVESMSNLTIDKKETPPEPEPAPVVVDEVAPPKKVNQPIKVDRSTLTFRTPTSTVGRNNAALCKALISAIRGQKANIVEQLLNRGVDPNGMPDSEEHPVIIACTLTDPNVLKLLLEFGGDPDADSKHHKLGALRIVCEHRFKKHLDLLLEYGADPNRDLPEYAVLPHAIWQSKFEFVEQCLKYGADPSHVSKNKVIPLNYIIQHNIDPKMLSLLIEWGADINKPDGEKQLPVAFACRLARPDHLKILLENGGDVSKTVENSDPALLYAFRANSLDCVRILLEHGADPKTIKGSLDHAIRTLNIEIVKLLLEAGADPNEKLEHDQVPLYTVLQIKARVEFMELLLAAGADPKLRPGIMEYAVSRNNFDAVKLLVEAGISVEDGSEGNSPLSTSIRDNRKEIFDFLIEAKADPNRMSGKISDSYPLFWAIMTHEEYVKPLLDAGADPNLIPELLEKAAWKNRLEAIKILLDHGFDIESVGPNKVTALHTALVWDRSKVVLYLLSRGADPNHVANEHVLLPAVLQHRNNCIEPLLKAGADLKLVPGIIELATWRNNLEGIKILVNNGASIEELPPSGFTPLQTSLRDGRKPIFEYLIAKGADPNHAGTEHPLYTAIGHGRIEYIEPLIKAGADAKALTGIVEIATWRNNLDIIKLLVAHGCGIEEVPKSGMTALQTACRDGREKIIDWLLSQGADPNHKGLEMPLEQAINSRHPNVVKKLLDAGADPKLCMPGLLAHAVWRNSLEVIQVLVESGKLDINGRHRDGESPLTVAIRDNHLNSFKYLLSKGADPNALGNGLPVVAASIRDGPTEMLEMLLKAGADPNVVETDHKRTALVEAASHGRMEKVKLLLENGANADLPNGRGVGALDAAAEKGHDEIVMILLEKME